MQLDVAGRPLGWGPDNRSRHLIVVHTRMYDIVISFTKWNFRRNGSLGVPSGPDPAVVLQQSSTDAYDRARRTTDHVTAPAAAKYAHQVIP
jgi:hypothetical protein